MKNFLLPAACIMAFAGFITGCTTTKTTTTNPPPKDNKGVIIKSDKSDAGVAIVTTPAPAKSLPPGQAKKVTGEQSAKAHAPGQLKKQSG